MMGRGAVLHALALCGLPYWHVLLLARVRSSYSCIGGWPVLGPAAHYRPSGGTARMIDPSNDVVMYTLMCSVHDEHVRMILFGIYVYLLCVIRP